VALAAVAVLTATTTFVACGIPGDSAPREISRDALPPELIEATGDTLPADRGALELVTLYLVDANERGGGESLVAVQRAAPMPSDPGEVPRAIIEALITASPEALGRTDLVNPVPSDVQVRSAVLGADGVLDLDLTNLGNVESGLQRLAVAQIVFTLTELDDPRVRGIRFSVDGKEVAVPTERGVVEPGRPVTRTDEAGLVTTTGIESGRTPARPR